MRRSSCSTAGFLMVALALEGSLSTSESQDHRAGNVRIDTTKTALRVDTNLVEIPVTVVDKRGRIVDNLTKENFLVSENGVDQTIRHFGSYEGPISACLVFDNSGSMVSKLNKSIEAVKDLLNAALSDDEYCLVGFSDWAETIVGFTSDPRRILRELIRLNPAGWTALLDAVGLGMEQVKLGHNMRKAIILISDGGDNRSRKTQQEINRLVRESEAQIYAIGIISSDDQILYPVQVDGPSLMKDISTQSGGRVFLIHEISQLSSAITKISAALRHEYLLGYYSADARNDGKYRHVSVKVNLPKGTPTVRAYWRSGYYGPVD